MTETDQAPLEVVEIDGVEYYRRQAVIRAWAKQNHEIEQVLGAALGYPWFFQDQKNFPGATEDHGVCVGEHVAESIAEEAAVEICRLRKQVKLSLDVILGLLETMSSLTPKGG